MTSTNWNSRSNRISLFLLARNKFFRQGVSAAMMQHTDIEIVGESDINVDAFELVQAVSPQIALVDANPPVLSGISLARHISQNLPGTTTVILTPYANDDELFQAITSGAVAYLSKDIEPNELANIIRRIADDELPVVESLIARPVILERVIRHFQNLSLKGRAANSMDGTITEREAEVLSYVACGYGNKQIAHALGISEQTIKNHMTSIMSKLDANDRTHAVVMALQYGWISTSTKTKQGSEGTFETQLD